MIPSPILKTEFEAVVVVGIAKISWAIREKTRYFKALSFYYVKMLIYLWEWWKHSSNSTVNLILKAYFFMFNKTTSIVSNSA